MKQFKRWWLNKFSSRKGNDNSYLGYPEAHQAWKAALEWAEEQVGNDYRKGYKAIKEELKEWYYV